MSEIVGLKEQNKAERKYYLGYLKPDDKVPGSDKTIKELRKEYQAGVEQENTRMRDRYLAHQEKIRKDAPPETVTSAVTAGVVVERERPVAVPLMVAADEPAEKPTRDDLLKKSKDDLKAEASEVHFHEVPDKATKADIVDNVIKPE